MPKLSVSIKNIDKLFYKLDKVRTMDLTDKVTKITTLVHGQAKALAPVDTGNLAGSIHMDVKKKENGVIEGRVYTNLQYAPYVEFGTGSKGNGTYGYKVKNLKLTYRDTSWVYTPNGGNTFYRTNGQVAQPYMLPAIRRNKKTMKKIMETGVGETLKKICKGGN